MAIIETSETSCEQSDFKEKNSHILDGIQDSEGFKKKLGGGFKKKDDNLIQDDEELIMLDDDQEPSFKFSDEEGINAADDEPQEKLPDENAEHPAVFLFDRITAKLLTDEDVSEFSTLSRTNSKSFLQTVISKNKAQIEILKAANKKSAKVDFLSLDV